MLSSVQLSVKIVISYLWNVTWRFYFEARFKLHFTANRKEKWKKNLQQYIIFLTFRSAMWSTEKLNLYRAPQKHMFGSKGIIIVPPRNFSAIPSAFYCEWSEMLVCPVQSVLHCLHVLLAIGLHCSYFQNFFYDKQVATNCVGIDIVDWSKMKCSGFLSYMLLIYRILLRKVVQEIKIEVVI